VYFFVRIDISFIFSPNTYLSYVKIFHIHDLILSPDFAFTNISVVELQYSILYDEFLKKRRSTIFVLVQYQVYFIKCFGEKIFLINVICVKCVVPTVPISRSVALSLSLSLSLSRERCFLRNKF
jgi:hypothetical protein